MDWSYSLIALFMLMVGVIGTLRSVESSPNTHLPSPDITPTDLCYMAHQALIATMNEAVIVIDMHYRIVDINPAAQTMFALSVDQVVGQPANQLLSCWEQIHESLHDDATILEFSIDQQDTTYFYEIQSTLVRNPNHQSIGWVIVIRDITRRKHAEEALHANNRLKRTIIDAIPSLIAYVDIEFRYQFVNTLYESWFNRPMHTIHQRHVAEIIGPACYRTIHHSLQRARTGQPIEHTWTMSTPMSGDRTIRSAYLPHINEHGEVQGIILIDQDITQQQEAEQTLRSNLHFLETLLDTIPSPVFYKDSMGRYQGCNPLFAEQVVGLPKEMILGQIAPELPNGAGEVLSTVCHAYDAELFANPGVQVYEAHVLCADSLYRDFIFLKSTFVNSDGDLAGLIGVMLDITEIKRSEEVLQRTHEELKMRVAELERYNYDITEQNRMGDLLQICVTPTEAYRIITQSATKIFARQSGSLWLLGDDQTTIEVVTSWGVPPRNSLIPADHCIALYRGRVHTVADSMNTIRCPHMEGVDMFASTCVPITAQGSVIGLLHVSGYMPMTNQEIAHMEQMAVMMAEHLALALNGIKLRDQLRQQAIRDPLTGLFNRRYLDESLERELRRAIRHRYEVGVIILDIDHFKRLNDTYGHDGGDAVLRAIALLLQSCLRSSDIVCRFGGEEFVLILPNASLENTRKRAESLRLQIQQIEVEHNGQSIDTITSSLGVACFPVHGKTPADLVSAADAALYTAKANGRDQVVIADVP